MGIPRDINILIIDDFYATRKALKKSLRAIGFSGEILEADQVAMARDIIINNPFYTHLDFIISDVDMPGESGLNLLSFVKGDNQFKKLPFIILSAIKDKGVVLDAIEKGVDNYLLKPWDHQSLLKKMESAWLKTKLLD
jgi:response regulator RpfG family c-di-GMP phosphodiesterase